MVVSQEMTLASVDQETKEAGNESQWKSLHLWSPEYNHEKESGCEQKFGSLVSTFPLGIQLHGKHVRILVTITIRFPQVRFPQSGSHNQDHNQVPTISFPQSGSRNQVPVNPPGNLFPLFPVGISHFSLAQIQQRIRKCADQN